MPFVRLQSMTNKNGLDRKTLSDLATRANRAIESQDYEECYVTAIDIASAVALAKEAGQHRDAMLLKQLVDTLQITAWANRPV